MAQFSNPFRPGAGHMPPYLAGRREETDEFRRLLQQDVILDNLVLTGLRGVGKTVLLDTLKPIAIQERWGWVGADLSESSSISEERLATRLMADLAMITASITIGTEHLLGMGLRPERKTVSQKLDYDTLQSIFAHTPGLVSDKLKAVLECVWRYVQHDLRGLVFAYDESQNLSDHAARNEYPLSLLLDVFQSIQKKGIRFMLVLVGLPTLFPKLVEARTFAERMFRVVFLDRLADEDSRDAISKPINDARCPVKLNDKSIQLIVDDSGGYPYFIQFICREVYDVFLQKSISGEKASVPRHEITRKLDTDFFAGRWARATDRQRDLMVVIANLENCNGEFTVQEIAEKSKTLPGNPFQPSHISQMLSAPGEAGLVYKNRHGKYSLAVPLMAQFILRQQQG